MEIDTGVHNEKVEAKEAKYRENWLVRQSHATQAEAVQVGAKTLKCKCRQKEGEHTGAVLRLKLGNIGDKSKQVGITVASRTTTPSGSRCASAVLQLQLNEINKKSKQTGVTSAFGTITSSQTDCMSEMVLKDNNKEMKNSNKGKMVLKGMLKVQNMGGKCCINNCKCVNNNGKVYMCSVEGNKGPGPPSMGEEVANKPPLGWVFYVC